MIFLFHQCNSMVPTGKANDNLRSRTTEAQQKAFTSSQSTRDDLSAAQTTISSGLPLIRQTLTSHGISAAAEDIIMASWRKGTSKQYSVYLKRWEQFCKARKINRLDASVETGIDFLANLLSSG